LEVGLFTEAQIPWSELAFPTVKQTLQWYFEDLHAGGFHHGRTRSRDILPSERIE
jgi:hypothetical protein